MSTFDENERGDRTTGDDAVGLGTDLGSGLSGLGGGGTGSGADLGGARNLETGTGSGGNTGGGTRGLAGGGGRSDFDPTRAGGGGGPDAGPSGADVTSDAVGDIGTNLAGVAGEGFAGKSG